MRHAWAEAALRRRGALLGRLQPLRRRGAAGRERRLITVQYPAHHLVEGEAAAHEIAERARLGGPLGGRLAELGQDGAGERLRVARPNQLAGMRAEDLWNAADVRRHE